MDSQAERELSEHRRRLEECEQGARECALRKPVAPREARRRRRIMIGIAAAVIAAAALLVPVVVAWVRSTSAWVDEGASNASETMRAIQRIEGYLKRDEERELTPAR